MTRPRAVELGPQLGPLRSERMLQVLIVKINDTQVTKVPFPHIRLTNVWVAEFTDRMVFPGNDWPTTTYPKTGETGRNLMTFPASDVGNIFADMAFMFESERLKETVTVNFQGVDIKDFVGHKTLLVQDVNGFELLPHTGSKVKSFAFIYSAHGSNFLGDPPDHPLGENRLHTQSIHSQQSAQRKAVADMTTTVGYQNDRNSMILFPVNKNSWTSVPKQTMLSGVRREMLHYYLTSTYTRKLSRRAAQP